jgi:hypothetical protein
MGDSLYDTDILAWSEQQAALLRRMARGERVNGVDWENVIEELESVGRGQTDSVRSHLFQCLLHLAKAAGSADPDLQRHWLVEVAVQQQQAADRFAPSMRQLIDVPALWRKARKAALLALGGRQAIQLVPAELPLPTDDLIAPEFDPQAVLRTVRAAAATAATA